VTESALTSLHPPLRSQKGLRIQNERCGRPWGAKVGSGSTGLISESEKRTQSASSSLDTCGSKGKSTVPPKLQAGARSKQSCMITSHKASSGEHLEDSRPRWCRQRASMCARGEHDELHLLLLAVGFAAEDALHTAQSTQKGSKVAMRTQSFPRTRISAIPIAGVKQAVHPRGGGAVDERGLRSSKSSRPPAPLRSRASPSCG